MTQGGGAAIDFERQTTRPGTEDDREAKSIRFARPGLRWSVASRAVNTAAQAGQQSLPPGGTMSQIFNPRWHGSLTVSPTANAYQIRSMPGYLSNPRDQMRPGVFGRARWRAGGALEKNPPPEAAAAGAQRHPPIRPSGLRICRMGQADAMGKVFRRTTILTAALAPIAALSLVMPAAGSAQPLDCQNGEWWDPVADVCQPPVAPVPLGCQNGDWWDPVGNVCRPPLAPFPPNCGDGQYWNPVSNACRPLGQI
jgi:hypothetical protein